jgi:hypothetical protein
VSYLLALTLAFTVQLAKAQSRSDTAAAIPTFAEKTACTQKHPDISISTGTQNKESFGWISTNGATIFSTKPVLLPTSAQMTLASIAGWWHAYRAVRT